MTPGDKTAEEKIGELGLDLSSPAAPVANYVPAVRTGNLVFLSGQGPRDAEGAFITGKVGSALSVDEAYAAARLVGIGLLAALRGELGSLDRVVRVVKTLGMVNAEPGFTDHPRVINGTSDLFVEVFGDAGRGARSAVGMGSLPDQIPVEVEMILEVRD